MTPGKICEPFCCRAPVALERWNLTLIVDGYCTATCPIEHVVLFQQCDVKGSALASKRLDMKCIKSRTCLLQVFPPLLISLPVCHQAGQILMLSLAITHSLTLPRNCGPQRKPCERGRQVRANHERPSDCGAGICKVSNYAFSNANFVAHFEDFGPFTREIEPYCN